MVSVMVIAVRAYVGVSCWKDGSKEAELEGATEILHPSTCPPAWAFRAVCLCMCVCMSAEVSVRTRLCLVCVYEHV